MSEVKVVNKRVVYVVVGILISIVVILTTVSGALYVQNQKSQSGGVNELESIMSKLDKVIELPTESPTLATVSDKNKLPPEPFYKKAENGDKVLVFSTAKKAILYRPGTGKIIEYVTVIGGQEVGSQSEATREAKITTPSVKEPIKIALFNATNLSGLTKIAENEIKKDLQVDIEVVRRGDAKQEYEKTLVVDLSGKHVFHAEQIAKLYNGQVGQYPEGEASVSADIAVFIVK